MAPLPCCRIRGGRLRGHRRLSRELHVRPGSQVLALFSSLGQDALRAGVVILSYVVPVTSAACSMAYRHTAAVPALVRPQGVREAEGAQCPLILAINHACHATGHAPPLHWGAAGVLPRRHSSQLEGVGTVV